MNSRYIAVIESDNVYAEIWVNNVPVGTVSPSESSPFSFPVNEYLVEGVNKVGIMLHAGPRPSTSDQPWPSDPKAAAYKGPAKLSMKFAKYSPEEVPFREHPPVLASIDWQGEAVPVPLYQEKEVSLPNTFDPPLWVSAQVFSTLDAALRNEAVDYLSYLYGLLAKQQFETYIELSKPRLDRLTKAYGMPIDPFLAQILAVMQEGSKPPFHLEPLNPPTIDLRLVGYGRMIDVQRTDRESIFVFKKSGSEEETFLPVRIGKKGGKWLMFA